MSLIFLSLNATAGCSGGCCGEITSVYHTIHGDDDITIYVIIKNTGSSFCSYRVDLYNEWDYRLMSFPLIGYIYLFPNEETTVFFTTTGLFPPFKLPDLGIEYTVNLTCAGCTSELDSVTKNVVPEGCRDYLGVNCVEVGKEIGDDAGNKVKCEGGGSCIINCEIKEGNCYCSLIHTCVGECVNKSEEREEPFCMFYPDFVCDGNFSCADNSTPTTSCSTVDECKIRCADACGKLTNCSDNCEACCLGETCMKTTYSSDERYACLNSCFGVCNMRKIICDIEGLLRAVAIWVAIVLFTFHSFKFLVYSGDPEARRKAKLGMLYVILGLLLFMIAIPLINYLYGGTRFVCYYSG